MVPRKRRYCVTKHSVSLTTAKCSSCEVRPVASDHQQSGLEGRLGKKGFIQEWDTQIRWQISEAEGGDLFWEKKEKKKEKNNIGLQYICSFCRCIRVPLIIVLNCVMWRHVTQFGCLYSTALFCQFELWLSIKLTKPRDQTGLVSEFETHICTSHSGHVHFHLDCLRRK